MQMPLIFRPLDPETLSTSRRRLWSLWHDLRGAPDILARLTKDKTLSRNAMVFDYPSHGVLSASFVGEAVGAREAGVVTLPQSFLEVYVPEHRSFVTAMFDRMAAAPCGAEGYVERRMASGQTPVRTRFLCLPILDGAGTAQRFVSVDNGVTYPNSGAIPDEASLPTGFTRLADVSLVRML